MNSLYTNKEECCGCGVCLDSCRKNAIRMVVDREGFCYPKVNEELCVDCGHCLEVCPIKKYGGKNRLNRQYYGVQAKDKKTRSTSSSGGMFPVLAEYILRHNGVVYGAGYTNNMKVIHKEIKNREELDSIKRTKYVQSNLKGIYRRIERNLKKNQWVLFCGTPCQAEGLRLFLNHSYSRLIIVDLVCYGVPSPGIWRSYVKYMEQKRRGKMTEFSFRDKRMSDNGHTCSYMINGKEYAGSLYRDIYCRMYFSNNILRPSCHVCKFCTVQRNSDITIGDFWGIENVKPEIDDGMGTSMLILHTDKGRKIWDAVQKGVSWFECEEKDVLQPRLLEPTGASKRRSIFMALYRLLPFSTFQILYRALASGMSFLRRVRG